MGLERLREAARKNRPWQYAQGPRSEKARAQSVINGKRRQLGPESIRELRRERQQWREILELVDQTRSDVEQISQV